MTIQILIQGAPFALTAAKYVGFVKDYFAERLDELAGAEFGAGLRAVEQAINAEQERQSLLREARARFNKAVSLERGLRLALAHQGLALCHWNLGDRVNAKLSLEDLLMVTPPCQSILVTITEKLPNAPWWLKRPWMRELTATVEKWKQDVIKEQEMLRELQISAQDCLTQAPETI